MSRTTKTKQPDPRALLRLAAITPSPSRLAVERAWPGAIRNASILTTGPAEGHDFQVDEDTVDQVVAHGDGIPGRWTHGGLCEDGLGRHLGRWERLRKESFRLCRGCEKEGVEETCATCGQPTTLEHRALGDFYFSPSAHRLKPDGLDVAAPVYLMERATENPKSLGISIVARPGFEEVEASEGDQPTRPCRLARIHRGDLRRADWVADPAANPIGLHAGTGGGSELLERVQGELDRLVEREGVGKTKLRALAFLSRYFRDDLADDESEVDRLERELTALRSENAELRARAEELCKADDQAYLERLRKESAETQAPIPAADLERVAKLLREGQGETARLLGDAFLERSKAQGQTAFSRAATQPLVPPQESAAKESAETQARLLGTRHWKSQLNEEGTKLVSSAPPGRK